MGCCHSSCHAERVEEMLGRIDSGTTYSAGGGVYEYGVSKARAELAYMLAHRSGVSAWDASMVSHKHCVLL